MLEFDFSNIMQSSIGVAGLSQKDFDNTDIKKINKIIEQRKYIELDFIDTHKQDLSEIKKMAKFAKRFDNFLLLGIGGSALGPASIFKALSPFHNYIKRPKIFIYDNIDPLTYEKILDLIDLKNTLINIISKSGNTVETIASFMIVWQRLKEQGINPVDNIVITTDPTSGNLRKIVNEYNLKSLPIKRGIVGRYSILSSVGLLLAETIGIKSEDLLNGARNINELCLNPSLESPAYKFAIGIYLMQKLKNRDITVMVPYTDHLKIFSEWFCQLWAESICKKGSGLTPYHSVGTKDQHSQLQAWMQGTDDKVIIFIALQDYIVDIKIPTIFRDIEGIGYLGGHSLSELIKVEQVITELAITKAKRPNITLTMPKIDAYHLGQLIQFFEIVTTITGFLYGINPFNQPGVEECKDFIYGMMGKKGYEIKKQEVIDYRDRKTFKT